MVTQKEMVLWLQIVTPIVRNASVSQQWYVQISTEPIVHCCFFCLGSGSRKCGLTWSGLVILKTTLKSICHLAESFLHAITGKSVALSIGPQNSDLKITA